jgi:hypothetical protein
MAAGFAEMIEIEATLVATTRYEPNTELLSILSAATSRPREGLKRE